jgi:phosphotransferase system HPr (HPr) family protein
LISTGKAVIAAEVGLHARPAADFVRAVEASGHNVTVTNKGKTVPGGSILGVLSLAAHQGDVVEISVEGPKSDEVLALLIAVVEGSKNH